MENSLKHGYNAIDHSVASHSTIRCNGAVKAPPLGGANASQRLSSPRKSSPVGGQTLLGSIGTGPIPTTERNVRTVEPTVRQRSETAVCPRWTFPKRKQTERTIIFMATRILFLTVHLYASHLSCISETQTRWHQ